MPPVLSGTGGKGLLLSEVGGDTFLACDWCTQVERSAILIAVGVARRTRNGPVQRGECHFPRLSDFSSTQSPGCSAETWGDTEEGAWGSLFALTTLLVLNIFSIQSARVYSDSVLSTASMLSVRGSRNLLPVTISNGVRPVELG